MKYVFDFTYSCDEDRGNLIAVLQAWYGAKSFFNSGIIVNGLDEFIKMVEIIKKVVPLVCKHTVKANMYSVDSISQYDFEI